MPVTPTYPGVYIEEIPSGVRTIVGVATSIGAFIDNFARGPLNEALELFSFADFEREFGGLSNPSNAGSEASYAIKQFFLNGGTDAFVVRVGVNPVAASVTLTGTVGGGAGNVFTASAGRRLRGLSVEDPGEWGNRLRIDVDYDTRVPNESIDPLQVQTRDELFNLLISETDIRNGRTVVVNTNSYPNLTLRPGARNNAIDIVNERSKLVQLDAGGAALAANDRPSTTGTLGAVLPIPFVAPGNGTVFNVTVDPDGPGGPTAAIIQPATLNYGANAPTTYAQLRSFIEQAIRDAAPATLPGRDLFLGATVQLLDERDANNVVTGQRFRVLLGRTGVDYNPAATVSFATAALGALLATLDVATATVMPQQFALTNGADGTLAGSAELRGGRAAKTGLYALEDVSLFNILCIPAAGNLADPAMRAVYSEAEAYCEERRAFLIIDLTQATVDLEGMQQWLSDNEVLRHRNAAVYFPRLEVTDPLNPNVPRFVGSSGTMAGLYAATDAERGVWKAPAGIDVRLRGIEQLEVQLTDRENGVLNVLGVNCHRNFPVYGLVSWGGRTLDGADQQASEWKYIPIRRLALFLEESLYRGTKWVVFEPNDEPLWAQIRLNVGAFMHSLFRKGAFQGQTPRDAYFVKCDAETTTQTDRNLGIVNIVVGFAPLKPAEFVIIKIQQIAGQIET